MAHLRSYRCLSVFVLAIFASVGPARAENEPIVIVVHGIGDGNRPDGWSDEAARAYGTDVREVTFRYGGRGVPESFKDFAPQAGDWALQVQRDIQNVAQSNPGRRIVIVSHSWGTVVTKMALDGGSAGGNSKELAGSTYQISPIQLQGGAMIDEWVTLGSPLGRGEGAKIAGTLDQVGVDVSPGRPKVVRNWTNIYSIEYTHMPEARKKDGQWFIVAGWKLMRKDPGRTSAIVGYQQGDDTKPDWIPASQIAQRLAQEKIPWK